MQQHKIKELKRNVSTWLVDKWTVESELVCFLSVHLFIDLSPQFVRYWLDLVSLLFIYRIDWLKWFIFMPFVALWLRFDDSSSDWRFSDESDRITRLISPDGIEIIKKFRLLLQLTHFACIDWWGSALLTPLQILHSDFLYVIDSLHQWWRWKVFNWILLREFH